MQFTLTGYHLSGVKEIQVHQTPRSAITERQFRIHYQPVVELKTRRILSFEALLRWDHPTQGLISPYRFIEAAEDTGVLVSIGHWLCRPAGNSGSGRSTTAPDPP